jgi:hypothetical protein
MNVLELLKSWCRKSTPISIKCLDESLETLNKVLERFPDQMFKAEFLTELDDVVEEIYFAFGQELNWKEFHEASLWIEDQLSKPNSNRHRVQDFIEVIKILQIGLKAKRVPDFKPLVAIATPSGGE